MSAPSNRAATGRLPLYRREPWLAALLAAFLVMVGSMLLPPEIRRWPLILASVLGAGGVLLLILHRPHPDADRHLREIGAPGPSRDPRRADRPLPAGEDTEPDAAPTSA